MPRNPLPGDSSDQDTLAWGTDPFAVASRDLTGTTLGDFVIERRLGRGGMGEVYLARQVSLNREIALKVIRPDLLASATALARFEKEAWTAAKLNDPNIVHIYAIGSIDKVRFIAMEYVQGTNLKDYLDRKGPPELPLAMSIMKQAGNAVRAAGEMGLIHRDIKPENILITRRGLVKVADFGLCRDQNDQTAVTITQQGVTMGTPLYMSPEQVQGFPLDHRSDLYSLGITFYHMLAGQPPFRGETPFAVGIKHVKEAPPDLCIQRPDLPADLCRLVMKLIEKAPDQRYQSAAEMLRDLAKIKESLQLATVSGGALSISTTQADLKIESAGSTATRVGTGSVSQLVSTEPTPKKWRIPRYLPHTLAFLILLLGGLVGWQGRSKDLLAEGPESPLHVPAVWMFPDWTKTPRQATAQAQYRYALIEASQSSREAAWTAVAGYFPTVKEWVSQANTQIGRELFRDRDVSRLEVFADELEKTSRGHDDRLAEILKVGAGVLKRDHDGVLNTFGSEFVHSLADPALAGLSLEITTESLVGIGQDRRTPSIVTGLLEIQRSLIFRMMEITLRDTFGRYPL